ncbi:STAS-like domain-containing protein [Methanoplanus endosymbiosus]|uniref:STAS-like domain-containing protein n=1 Tax=Methanoplanus endosymbiosus TaxID=33865 RepID=A0A9E7PMJ6_9EURY|nr:STAS-like domain-containing protein [Methanoplanus endosymbiosus]UUX92974.1 STAS-like domain-containing protein [Methanoplanus endosymbiosus]
MTINVQNIIGENCITLEDGEKVYRLILSALNNNQNAELDFTGVRIYSSPFFNGAVAKLLGSFTPEELNARVKFAGLTKHGDQVLRRVIQNARKYYSNDKFRSAVNKVAAEHSESC